MKKIGICIAIQLINIVHANNASVEDILKSYAQKPTNVSYSAGQFSAEFCKLILNSAPDIIREKLWVLKNSKDPQCLQGRKFLFYGPSGSGKTTLAQVMAQDLGRPLLYINAGKLANEYANSASSNFRRIIDEQLQYNSVLVIDEMDCIMGEQNKNSPDINTPAQVWATLDDLHKVFPHVLIIGITNKIEKLPDPVRTRFSQLTLKIVSNENVSLRKQIFMHYLEGVIHECDEKFLITAAKKTSKISIRELVHVITEAKEISIARNANPHVITKKDVEEAIKRSLARKKEADNTNISWIPSETFFYKMGMGILGILEAAVKIQQFRNDMVGSSKPVNESSDLEMMKKI